MTHEETRRPILSSSCRLGSATVWLIAAAFTIGMGNGSTASTNAMEKSELVLKLEAVFNDPSFASTPEKLFPRHGPRRQGRWSNRQYPGDPGRH